MPCSILGNSWIKKNFQIFFTAIFFSHVSDEQKPHSLLSDSRKASASPTASLRLRDLECCHAPGDTIYLRREQRWPCQLSNGRLWEKQIHGDFLNCLMTVICHWVPNIWSPTSEQVKTTFHKPWILLLTKLEANMFDHLNWQTLLGNVDFWADLATSLLVSCPSRKGTPSLLPLAYQDIRDHAKLGKPSLCVSYALEALFLPASGTDCA